jgi:hypothetical protein
MKLSAKLFALGVAAVLMTAVASATTLQFGSYSTADPLNAFGNQNTPLVFVPGMSTTGATVPTVPNTQDLNPGSVWHAALPNSAWVSWGPTGPTNPPSLAPSGPTDHYVFQSSFDLPGQAIGFSFSILADDTVTVYLDGVTGNALFMQAPGPNHICQDLLPNCDTVDTVTSNSPFGPAILALLTPGHHVMTFDVLENFPIDMGLDFSATVDIVPEQSSLLLLGTGLIGSAGVILRKVRAAHS